MKNATKKWTMSIKNRALALNQFKILCGDFEQNLLEHNISNTQIKWLTLKIPRHIANL